MSDVQIKLPTVVAVQLYALLIETRRAGGHPGVICDDDLAYAIEGVRVGLINFGDAIAECGSCGGYHHDTYTGDCRNDRYRY